MDRASVGQVSYSNVGWSDTIGGGNANLSSNSGWVYTFLANVTGSFVINYNVSAEGTSSTTSNPMFGLNGFNLYEGAGATAPQNATFQTGVNTNGTVSLAITAGQTYTVQIQDFANIGGLIGTTNAEMSGTFNFDVQPLEAQAAARAFVTRRVLGQHDIVHSGNGAQPAQSVSNLDDRGARDHVSRRSQSCGDRARSEPRCGPHDTHAVIACVIHVGI